MPLSIQSQITSSKVVSLKPTSNVFFSTRLIIKEKHRVYLLDKLKIIRCEATGNYTTVHLDDGKSMLVSRCLKQVNESLSSSIFIRIHAKHLVNLNHIKSISTSAPRSLCLLDETELSISRSKYQNIKNLLNL